VQDRCPGRPWPRDELHRVEPDGHDEIGTRGDRFLDHAAREHAQHERVWIGEHTLGLVRDQHRCGTRLGERAQPLRGLLSPTLEAHDDHRSLRRAEQSRRRVERFARRRLERPTLHGGRDGDGRTRRHVGGDVEMHGAARLRHRELAGVRDPVGRRRRLDGEARLRDGRQHGAVLDGLVRRVGQRGGGMVIGEQQHG
jgi:hypothetical protein